MHEGQRPSVQHLSRCGVIREFAQPGILFLPINVIADQWEANVLKMNPDLVRSPSVQPRARERRVPQSLDDFITRP